MNQQIQIHGGDIYNASEQLGIDFHKIIDASASLVPFSPTNAFKLSLWLEIVRNSFKHYPDSSFKSLRHAIGAHHNISPEMILPGNGAAELFTWAAKDAANYGLNCITSPGFYDYERALKCWNSEYKCIPLPLSWGKKFPQQYPLMPDSKVLWINNPNNPTGQLWSRKSILNLIRKYALVIIDEAFLPLVPNGESQSLIPLIEKHPNLIIIRSLTKLFGIAGIRLGYAISSPDRLKAWSEWRDPWPLNSFAISSGIKLMNDSIHMQKWTKKVQGWIQKEGQFMFKKLDNLTGIFPYPSATNFLLIEGKYPLINLREKLAKKNILLRDCRSFKGLGDHWLRISLQTEQKNKKIIKGIYECIK